MRQVAKIWTALSKLIRSQVNKGRIIDTLYFGSFGKTTVMKGDQQAGNTYSYCPGPRSVFDLQANSENVKTVSQSISRSSFVRTRAQAFKKKGRSFSNNFILTLSRLLTPT